MKKTLTGFVVSNKMKNTVVIETERIVVSSKYKRRYKRHKNYHVHVKDGNLLIGDKIMVKECKPISKTVRWDFVKKIVSAGEKPEEVVESELENKPEEAENKPEKELE